SYLRKMSASKGGRASRKKTGLKVGGKLHCSWRDAEVFFPLLKMQMKEEMDGVCALYCFEEEEIAFLSGKTKAEVEKERKKKEKKENGDTEKENGKTASGKKARGRKKKEGETAVSKKEGGKEIGKDSGKENRKESGKEADASKKNGSLADFV
ncbi:hypothetical protein COV61_04290, partial [Candidatus Micrarchaeota archaeon CG11_big_fil_rev_8_21_14_0_20_47_5]